MALLHTIFPDFWLFYDFLEGLCEKSVLIFTRLNTAHNFGIKFRAFYGPLREIAPKLVRAKISTFKVTNFGKIFELSSFQDW